MNRTSSSSVEHHSSKSPPPETLSRTGPTKIALTRCTSTIRTMCFSASRIVDMQRESPVGEGTLPRYSRFRPVLFRDEKNRGRERGLNSDEGHPPICWVREFACFYAISSTTARSPNPPRAARFEISWRRRRRRSFESAAIEFQLQASVVAFPLQLHDISNANRESNCIT